MNYAAEFATVDAVVAANVETSGVDAFALSVIKAERQMRKLLTHLVYQAGAFGPSEIPKLVETLAENREVYFEGFIAGWDALYPRTIAHLVGNDYQALLARLKEATRHRNKIFHGQLTNQSLSRDDLTAYVADIRAWCSTLAAAASSEVGYDGFARNSFRKSSHIGLAERLTTRFGSVADYAAFIHAHMERE